MNVVWWWVSACVLAGCTSEPTPVEKCDDLVNVICDRGVVCLPGAGSHATCVSALQQALPCGSAKEVSVSYDRCISQLQGDSCAILFPVNPQTGNPQLVLPADCKAVILTREAPASPAPASSAMMASEDGQTD